MSTNKLSHLKEGEKIYLEVTRTLSYNDDEESLVFKRGNRGMYIDDDDTFYTLDDLKQLANDGTPKQGEMIQVRDKSQYWCDGRRFVCMYEGRVVVKYDGEFEFWDEWQPLPKKTELTLAEIESRLGLDAGSLIII